MWPPPPTTGRTFRCGRCSSPFPSYHALRQHIDELNHHQCMRRGCNRNFDSRMELLTHQSYCEPTPDAPSVTATAPTSDRPSAGRSYTCAFDGCHLVFADPGSFSAHLRNERHHVCTVCKERFGSHAWKFAHVCRGPASSLPPAAAFLRAGDRLREREEKKEEEEGDDDGEDLVPGRATPQRAAATTTTTALVSLPLPPPPMSSCALSTLRDVERLRQRVRQLAQRPHAYDPAGKKRYVFMDADNIVFSMRNSSHLHHVVVPPARSSQDLRLNWEALTRRVCASPDGAGSELVRSLRATYFEGPEEVIEELAHYGWSVERQSAVRPRDVREPILRGRSRHEMDCSHALVLVTGDGDSAGHGSSFRNVVDQFLQLNWCVEIHAWAHALHEGYVRFMEEYASHVCVYLLDETPEAVAELVDVDDTARVAVTDTKDDDRALRAERTALETRSAALSREVEAARAKVTAARAALAALASDAEGRERERLDAQWAAFNHRQDALSCALTGSVFVEPVLLACCRHTVSRHALEAWLEQQQRCPYCSRPDVRGIENRLLQDLVRGFLEEVPY